MPKIPFDVYVANSFAIDVTYDLHQVWWMEVYPFRFNQSKSLLSIYLSILSALLSEYSA